MRSHTPSTRRRAPIPSVRIELKNNDASSGTWTVGTDNKTLVYVIHLVKVREHSFDARIATRFAVLDRRCNLGTYRSRSTERSQSFALRAFPSSMLQRFVRVETHAARRRKSVARVATPVFSISPDTASILRSLRGWKIFLGDSSLGIWITRCASAWRWAAARGEATFRSAVS
jgi:hypothetical protein